MHSHREGRRIAIVNELILACQREHSHPPPQDQVTARDQLRATTSDTRIHAHLVRPLLHVELS